MFNFSIRPAQPSDVTSIYNLNCSTGNVSLSFDEVKQAVREAIISPKCVLLIAIHSQRIAGYIYAKEVTSLCELPYVRITDLVAVEYYIEKGVFEHLIGAVEKWTRQMVSSKLVFSAENLPLSLETALSAENFVVRDKCFLYEKRFGALRNIIPKGRNSK